MERKHFGLAVPPPTPVDELCSCKKPEPVKLMPSLSFNPIHCMRCNLEVNPQPLRLPPDLIQGLEYWNSIYESIYRLWLDSGVYEAWARKELEEIDSYPNRSGRQLALELGLHRTCYYWGFQDQSALDFRPLRECPSCGKGLTPYQDSKLKQLICDNCLIAFAG